MLGESCGSRYVLSVAPRETNNKTPDHSRRFPAHAPTKLWRQWIAVEAPLQRGHNDPRWSKTVPVDLGPVMLWGLLLLQQLGLLSVGYWERPGVSRSRGRYPDQTELLLVASAVAVEAVPKLPLLWPLQQELQPLEAKLLRSSAEAALFRGFAFRAPVPCRPRTENYLLSSWR